MMNIEELNAKAHALRELKIEREKMDERITALENDLKAEMTERGEYELIGDDWKVTWNEVSSSRFDQKLFREAHPDLYEQYKTSSSSRRFLLG